MPTLQIRNVPEELYEELKSMAKEARRSINQQAIVVLKKAIEDYDDSKKTKKAKAIEWIINNREQIQLDPKLAEKWIREDRDRKI